MVAPPSAATHLPSFPSLPVCTAVLAQISVTFCAVDGRQLWGEEGGEEEPRQKQCGN